MRPRCYRDRQCDLRADRQDRRRDRHLGHRNRRHLDDLRHRHRRDRGHGMDRHRRRLDDLTRACHLGRLDAHPGHHLVAAADEAGLGDEEASCPGWACGPCRCSR